MSALCSATDHAMRVKELQPTPRIDSGRKLMIEYEISRNRSRITGSTFMTAEGVAGGVVLCFNFICDLFTRF